MNARCDDFSGSCIFVHFRARSGDDFLKSDIFGHFRTSAVVRRFRLSKSGIAQLGTRTTPDGWPIVILSVLAKDLAFTSVARYIASKHRMTFRASPSHPRVWDGRRSRVGIAHHAFRGGRCPPYKYRGCCAPRRLGAQRAVREQRFRFDNRENILLPISFSSLARCAPGEGGCS